MTQQNYTTKNNRKCAKPNLGHCKPIKEKRAAENVRHAYRLCPAMAPVEPQTTCWTRSRNRANLHKRKILTRVSLADGLRRKQEGGPIVRLVVVAVRVAVAVGQVFRHLGGVLVLDEKREAAASETGLRWTGELLQRPRTGRKRGAN